MKRDVVYYRNRQNHNKGLCIGTGAILDSDGKNSENDVTEDKDKILKRGTLYRVCTCKKETKTVKMEMKLYNLLHELQKWKSILKEENLILGRVCKKMRNRMRDSLFCVALEEYFIQNNL